MNIDEANPFQIINSNLLEISRLYEYFDNKNKIILIKRNFKIEILLNLVDICTMTKHIINEVAWMKFNIDEYIRSYKLDQQLHRWKCHGGFWE